MTVTIRTRNVELGALVGRKYICMSVQQTFLNIKSYEVQQNYER